MKSHQSRLVPRIMQTNYEQVVALTDSFCAKYLNDEYCNLARNMTAALCRKRPSPMTSGQPRSWACGVIYALGQVNFLADKATEPYMAMSDVCSKFNVSVSTAGAKARTISDRLNIHPMDPTWMLANLVDRNPLVWMAEVNGILVDLRLMPREVQAIAYEKGMIPYIPADQS